MSKATIEFDLHDHEDVMDLNRYMASMDMAIAIFNLKCNLPKRIEHWVDSLSPLDWDSPHKISDHIIKQVLEELENIDIDKIIE